MLIRLIGELSGGIYGYFRYFRRAGLRLANVPWPKR
jgi:hypothetical protein